MLKLDKICKQYHKDGRTVKVLDSVSLSLEPGQFVVIQGPSGCGKSTMLLTMGALLHPDSGVVSWDGADIYAMSKERRAGFRSEQIGFVFQQFHLLPYLSVRDNVLVPQLVSSKPDLEKRTDELLSEFGLVDRQSHFPSELSVGERQRVALSRALLLNPKIILADEPTGNLDDANASLVLEAFRNFTKSGGLVVMVTHSSSAAHDADQVLRFGKEIL